MNKLGELRRARESNIKWTNSMIILSIIFQHKLDEKLNLIINSQHTRTHQNFIINKPAELIFYGNNVQKMAQ